MQKYFENCKAHTNVRCYYYYEIRCKYEVIGYRVSPFNQFMYVFKTFSLYSLQTYHFSLNKNYAFSHFYGNSAWNIDPGVQNLEFNIASLENYLIFYISKPACVSDAYILSSSVHSSMYSYTYKLFIKCLCCGRHYIKS